jgi:hypothetical protein
LSCAPVGACGSFAQTHASSGIGVLYTAPATPGNVVLTATSVTNPSRSTSGTITVTSAASQTLAPGNYVFSISGTDKNQSFYSAAGAFTVGSNGAITGGEEDFVDATHQHAGLGISSGTYTTSGSGSGNLSITLTTTPTMIGVNGVETLNVALVSKVKGLVTEFDSFATSTGTFDAQPNPLVTASGGYAFYSIGQDAAGLPMTIGGVFDVDAPPSISGNGSVFDVNDGGTLYLDESFQSGTVVGPDSFGRVVIDLYPAVTSLEKSAFALSGYMIDATHIQFVEGGDVLHGVTGGMALGQGNNTGTFNGTSFSGSYVFGASGLEHTGGEIQLAGLLTADADNTLSGNLSSNNLSAQTAQGGSAITGGTYTAGPEGRVTVTGLAAGANFTYNLILYLTGDGHALLTSADSGEVLAGEAFQRSGTAPFTASSFAGSYATSVAEFTSADLNFAGNGLVVADGVSSFKGNLDLNEQDLPVSDLPVTGTFTANAKGIFTGNVSGLYTTNTAFPVDFTYYVVDPALVLGIETDATQETLVYFELQQ